MRIAVSAGEPAGIGPDICLALAGAVPEAEVVVIGDADVLARRAAALAPDISLQRFHAGCVGSEGKNTLLVENVPAPAAVVPGQLNPGNGGHVLAVLDRAVAGCRDGEFDAMVTAPVHKGVINDGGAPFTGHTEFLAERCGGGTPVMMLATPGLRVALLTTHLPLRAVPEAITGQRLEIVVRILHRELQERFGISAPRLLVCGLNPHAGEGGHLGGEDMEVLEPALRGLRTEGIDARGPIPADTAFTPAKLGGADVVLAMYHDQGLPVIKHMGFGNTVNITLGLPIVRTSVDHGTALDLAGTGRASAASLLAAVRMAVDIARFQAHDQV